MHPPEPAELPAPVLAALRAARRGVLDYESARVLMIWGADNLPIRPERLEPRPGLRPGGAVFWEQGVRRGRRRAMRYDERDAWRNSGGERAVQTMSDPNGVGPSLIRRSGRVLQCVHDSIALCSWACSLALTRHTRCEQATAPSQHNSLPHLHTGPRHIYEDVVPRATGRRQRRAYRTSRRRLVNATGRRQRRAYRTRRRRLVNAFERPAPQPRTTR
jgi:hypothetical protein